MDSGPKYAFFKGKVVPIDEAKVSVVTHSFNYGTGVFAGLRGYWNEEREQLYLFRPYDHFTRFMNSAKIIMISVPYTVQELVDATLELLRHEQYRQDCYVRPLAYKSSEKIGVRLHELEDDVTIFSVPFGAYMSKEEDVHAHISSWRRLDDNAIPPRAKIVGAYASSAMAKTDAMLHGYDEAIVLDQDGHVSEGSAENIFIIRDGVAITPPVYANILEGITRRTVITILRDEMGVEVVEREIDRSELYVADEAFFCGTGAQIAAITKVDHWDVGEGVMGPIVRELRRRYFDIVRGRDEKYSDWILPVYR